MYLITLGNGKTIDVSRISGNNFVTDQDISEAYFDGGLRNVNIKYTGNEADEGRPCDIAEGTHEFMKLIYCKKFKDEPGTFFILEDYSQKDLREAKLEARLDYLEMMIEPDDTGAGGE